MRLKAENIYFEYKAGQCILDRVNFEIESGEIIGIMAPSGFGKTTLGKVLAGYVKPAEGRVTLDGAEIKSRGYHPVQLIFQHPEKAVDPKWKMRQALAETQMPSEELMTAMGIEKAWLDRWPSELSGGELQRFCVLRALTPQTKFLIADEMTTMLDAITQAQIWKTVLDYAQKHNMGVLVISHDRDLLEQVCQRVVNLNP